MSFQGKCNHCGKYGHKEVLCWKKYGKPKSEEQNKQTIWEIREWGKEVSLKVLSEEVRQGNNTQEKKDTTNQEPNQEYNTSEGDLGSNAEEDVMVVEKEDGDDYDLSYDPQDINEETGTVNEQVEGAMNDDKVPQEEEIENQVVEAKLSAQLNPLAQRSG